MVSNNEGTRLSVIQGMKDDNECAGHCKSESAKEPLGAQTPLDVQRYDESLKRLLEAKLAHAHRKQRLELEDQMRELEFKFTLEKLTFEAALDGVPVKHIEESHEQAFEALESAQNRVA